MNKNKEILFLNPPTAAIASEPLLNIALLTAILREAGYKVKVIDATAPNKPWSKEQIYNYVKETQISFIAVTLTIDYIYETYEFLSELSKLNVPIIAGGPHANAEPTEVITNSMANIVCIGEGDETIIELAEYFDGKRELESILGIAYKSTEKNIIKYTDKRPLIKDIDSLPFADLTDFPIENYESSSMASDSQLFWSIFSTRGCPFDCIFCSSHNVFGRTTRKRSAKNIFEEVYNLYTKYNARHFAFQDDEILSFKPRFLEFCDLLINSKLDITFSIRTRIDRISEEIIKKAVEANMTRISFGIESWNDETLKKINKLYTVQQIKEGFSVLEKFPDLKISFNNIIGFPWENKEHYASILNEISKIPESINFYTNACTPIPYPKTKMYDMYNSQYGFTDWWLNYNLECNHKPLSNKEIPRPFFMKFISSFITLYQKDEFWSYNKTQKDDIYWFSWELVKIFFDKHLNALDASELFLMCKTSWETWINNPTEEMDLAKEYYKHSKLKDWQKKLNFTTKEKS